MDKDQGVGLLGSLEHGKQVGLVPVQPADVGSDAHPDHPGSGHHPLQLPHGGGGILHGQRPKPGEPAGMIGDDSGDLIVDRLGALDGVAGVEVVAEQDRVERDHLSVDAGRRPSWRDARRSTPSVPAHPSTPGSHPSRSRDDQGHRSRSGIRTSRSLSRRRRWPTWGAGGHGRRPPDDVRYPSRRSASPNRQQSPHVSSKD